MTLKELLEGKTFPVKVRLKTWGLYDWFEIIAPQRKEHYPGFYQDGKASAICEYKNHWEMYTEPKKKKKMYAWLVTPVEDNEPYALGKHDVKYTSTEFSIRWNCHEYYPPKRVPALDFEMDE